MAFTKVKFCKVVEPLTKRFPPIVSPPLPAVAGVMLMAFVEVANVVGEEVAK